MGLQVVRHRLWQKPRAGALLDTSGGLLRFGGVGSFLFALDEGSGITTDLVNGWQGTLTAGSSWAATPYGAGVNVASGQGVALGDHPGPSGLVSAGAAAGLTVFALVYTGAGGGGANQKLVAQNYADGAWNYPYVNYYLSFESGGATLGVGGGGFLITATVALDGTSSNAKPNTPYLVVGSWDGVTQYITVYDLAAGKKFAGANALAATMAVVTRVTFVGSDYNNEACADTILLAGVVNHPVYNPDPIAYRLGLT